MATGGTFSGSLSKGCYEFFNYCCMPCSNQDKIVEDCYWRWECDEYLCRKCYDYHSKLGATSCHKVLGKDQIMGKVTGYKSQKQLPTWRCQVHRKQSIEIYCADHDVICTYVNFNYNNNIIIIIMIIIIIIIIIILITLIIKIINI